MSVREGPGGVESHAAGPSAASVCTHTQMACACASLSQHQRAVRPRIDGRSAGSVRKYSSIAWLYGWFFLALWHSSKMMMPKSRIWRVQRRSREPVRSGRPKVPTEQAGILTLMKPACRQLTRIAGVITSSSAAHSFAQRSLHERSGRA